MWFRLQLLVPGLSATNRMMTYPLAGTLTVSLIGGFIRLRPGMFPFIQLGSAHVASEQPSFKHWMSGLRAVEFPVIGSKGGYPIFRTWKWCPCRWTGWTILMSTKNLERCPFFYIRLWLFWFWLVEKHLMKETVNCANLKCISLIIKIVSGKKKNIWCCYCSLIICNHMTNNALKIICIC